VSKKKKDSLSSSCAAGTRSCIFVTICLQILKISHLLKTSVGTEHSSLSWDAEQHWRECLFLTVHIKAGGTSLQHFDYSQNKVKIMTHYNYIAS
jgi:hypothetical protein